MTLWQQTNIRIKMARAGVKTVTIIDFPLTKLQKKYNHHHKFPQTLANFVCIQPKTFKTPKKNTQIDRCTRTIESICTGAAHRNTLSQSLQQSKRCHNGTLANTTTTTHNTGDRSPTAMMAPTTTAIWILTKLLRLLYCSTAVTAGLTVETDFLLWFSVLVWQNFNEKNIYLDIAQHGVRKMAVWGSEGNHDNKQMEP